MLCGVEHKSLVTKHNALVAVRLLAQATARETHFEFAALAKAALDGALLACFGNFLRHEAECVRKTHTSHAFERLILAMYVTATHLLNANYAKFTQ